MTSKSCWQGLERVVSDFLGCKSRTPFSGSLSGITGADCIDDELFPECKLKSTSAIHTLFDKVQQAAKREKKLPLLCLKRKFSRGFIIAVHSDNLDDFIRIYSARKLI